MATRIGPGYLGANGILIEQDTLIRTMKGSGKKLRKNRKRADQMLPCITFYYTRGSSISVRLGKR